MQSHVGRSRRTHLSRFISFFFFLFFSNVAGTGVYVEYRREEKEMEICSSSTSQADRTSINGLIAAINRSIFVAND